MCQREYLDNSSYYDEWKMVLVIDIGLSTDNYTKGLSCGHEERQSQRYAINFFLELSDTSNDVVFPEYNHYNEGFHRTASKKDFSVNGAISNEIDFMIYIGHGFVAKNDSKGTHIHYSFDENGTRPKTDCDDPIYNMYSSEMHFGSSESQLRWVWLYTCNFLNTNDYVSDNDFKKMMTGAHIVMGYATQSTLCDAMALEFAKNLRDGMPIIDAYFLAGVEGEGSVVKDDNHRLKALYIPQAENETIYSPRVNYEYNSSDVRIKTSYIHPDKD